MTKTCTVPSHRNNPVTHEEAAERFLVHANEDLRRAALREGERRERSEASAAGNFGFAAYELEWANRLRGDLSFSRLDWRDLSIDEAFARYEADERRVPQSEAA